MKKIIITSCLYTLITAVVLGLGYPALVTLVAHVAFPNNSRGQLITRGGEVVGSRIIGQPFSGPGYFHSRPSAAGTGYDASSSSGSNLAPTSGALVKRVDATVQSESNGTPLPVDLATASASGLDPDISPASAYYQVGRVAKERRLSEEAVRSLVAQHITPRQFGLLGEPRVNVLELNLALDAH